MASFDSREHACKPLADGKITKAKLVLLLVGEADGPCDPGLDTAVQLLSRQSFLIEVRWSSGGEEPQAGSVAVCAEATRLAEGSRSD